MTTVETARSKSKTSEALSTRSMVTSIVFHTLVLLLLLLVPAKMLLPRRASKKEVDVVFYRAPKIVFGSSMKRALLTPFHDQIVSDLCFHIIVTIYEFGHLNVGV